MSAIPNKAAQTVSAVNNLGTTIAARLGSKLKTSALGVANGAATLNSSVLIPVSQMDPQALQPGQKGYPGQSPYDIPCFVNGQMLAGEYIMKMILLRYMQIPSGFIYSQATCGTPSTNQAIIDIIHNSTILGSIVFNPGSTVGVFVGANGGSQVSDIALSPGGYLMLRNRGGADPSLANITINLFTYASASQVPDGRKFVISAAGYTAMANGANYWLKMNGALVTSGTRSYNFVTFDNNGNVTGTSSFDVIGGQGPQAATWLNNLPVGTLVVAFTVDEPAGGRLDPAGGGFLEAMKTIGASSNVLVSNGPMKYRSAYILMGRKEANDTSVHFEAYSGLIDSDPNSATCLSFNVSGGAYTNLIQWY